MGLCPGGEASINTPPTMGCGELSVGAHGEGLGGGTPRRAWGLCLLS